MNLEQFESLKKSSFVTGDDFPGATPRTLAVIDYRTTDGRHTTHVYMDSLGRINSVRYDSDGLLIASHEEGPGGFSLAHLGHSLYLKPGLCDYLFVRHLMIFSEVEVHFEKFSQPSDNLLNAKQRHELENRFTSEDLWFNCANLDVSALGLNDLDWYADAGSDDQLRERIQGQISGGLREYALRDPARFDLWINNTKQSIEFCLTQQLSQHGWTSDLKSPTLTDEAFSAFKAYLLSQIGPVLDRIDSIKGTFPRADQNTQTTRTPGALKP